MVSRLWNQDSRFIKINCPRVERIIPNRISLFRLKMRELLHEDWFESARTPTNPTLVVELRRHDGSKRHMCFMRIQRRVWSYKAETLWKKAQERRNTNYQRLPSTTRLVITFLTCVSTLILFPISNDARANFRYSESVKSLNEARVEGKINAFSSVDS